jgi:hypothetical protein
MYPYRILRIKTTPYFMPHLTFTVISVPWIKKVPITVEIKILDSKLGLWAFQA